MKISSVERKILMSTQESNKFVSNNMTLCLFNSDSYIPCNRKYVNDFIKGFSKFILWNFIIERDNDDKNLY